MIAYIITVYLSIGLGCLLRDFALTTKADVEEMSWDGKLFSCICILTCWPYGIISDLKDRK